MSLRVWHGVVFVVCSELVACVVFRLKRCVVTALFARVVVHRQPQTDTDRQTHTHRHGQTRTNTDTSDCLFVCFSFHVFSRIFVIVISCFVICCRDLFSCLFFMVCFSSFFVSSFVLLLLSMLLVCRSCCVCWLNMFVCTLMLLLCECVCLCCQQKRDGVAPRCFCFHVTCHSVTKKRSSMYHEPSRT